MDSRPDEREFCFFLPMDKERAIMKHFVFGQGIRRNRSGAVLILMTLLIVVLCCLIWLDPMALFKKGDPDLPWNQESRLRKRGEKAAVELHEQQPHFSKALRIETRAYQGEAKRGKISLMIHPDGRMEGNWSGKYNPKPNVCYDIMIAAFKGNTDPSKIYEDKHGQDLSKLFFIAKGPFVILESEGARNRSVKGYIYVTGWLEPDYKVTGEIIITSDKRTFKTFNWQGQGMTGRFR